MRTGHEFLDAEFDASNQGYGGGHADHGAGFDGQRTANCELKGQDRVAVTVGDAEGATVEGAHVVDLGASGDEVSDRGCP